MSMPELPRMAEQPPSNVLAAAANGFAEFMERNGGDAQRVLSEVGVGLEELQDETRPVYLSTYVRMMERAAELTGNSNFGLHFGRQFRPEMLGLIGGIAMASPTLAMALRAVADLFPYHQQATHTAFKRQGDMVKFEYRILDGSIVERRQDAELTLGMIGNIIRHCLGERWTPTEVHLEHPKPLSWRDHEYIFRAPVHFAQRTNALVFYNDHLDHRMPHADLARANSLGRELIRVSGGVGSISLLGRVKGEIRSRLPEGIPYIELVAEALGLQRWTLQRRLADYGLTFSAVIDIVRRELSERHIRQPYVSLIDISDLLGFSELSAFSRAFRRWHGVSPQQMRTRIAKDIEDDYVG